MKQGNITFTGELNVNRFFQTLADIIGDREGVEITAVVTKRENKKEEKVS